MTLDKKKISVVINNRANYARIKSFLNHAKKKKNIDLNIILGASSILERFGSLENILKKDKFNVSNKIYTLVDGDKPITMAKSTALEINELSNIFEHSKPDAVVAIADRFETMAVAIAASYMNIPLIHTQGGEVTGSIDESVRHAISKLANIHFPSNYTAKKNLIKMGEDPKTVFNIGCPSIDLAKSILKKKFNLKKILLKYKYSYNGKKELREFSDYIILVQHPVTTEYELTKKHIKETIKAVSKSKHNFLWLWPNVDSGSDIISKQLRINREKGKLDNVIFIKNFQPEDFLLLLKNSSCVVGNSSVGIREAAFLGVPCVNIGNRQNKRQKDKNVINCEHKSSSISKKINYQFNKKYKCSRIYGDGSAGKKMANVISKMNLTYTQKALKL
jgi:UDP-hydrolysing UDP-N-acetyl-D-glucosamine 2-epimerase